MVEAIRRIFFSCKIVSAILGLSMCNGIAQGSDKELLAWRAYEQGNWKEASILYESIDPKDSADWYNLGNAYYRQERCADALICWKRAMKGATLCELRDIEFNSACLSKKLGSCMQHSSWNSWVCCVLPSPWIIQFM